MTLTNRDRKILLFLVPVLLVAAFWFLLLAPKREEAGRLGEELAGQEQRRDAAIAHLAQLESAKTTFAADYAAVTRLGKAVPATVDMPSLLVQLDEAARGTGIDFRQVAAGERTPASPPSGAPGGGPPGEPAPAASGGAPGASGGAPGASGGAPGAGGGAAGASGRPALDTVPLQFTFTGRFFDLADFFHRMKRFVHVVNGRVQVSGRLMTIDSFSFTSDEAFPTLKAEVAATVYLTPKAEGVTAGASPGGPSGTTPASTSGDPAATSGAPAATPGTPGTTAPSSSSGGSPTASAAP